MRTDKIRKYLIPNIPYLFILWAFLKLGTAYRLAEGNDFAHKLIGLGQTIGPAFADFAADTDWKIRRTGTRMLIGSECIFYNSILQGMECNNTDSSSRIQEIDHVIQ